MIAGQCFTLRKLDTSSPTKRAGLLGLNRLFEPPTGLSLSAPLAAVFYISLGSSAVIFSLAPGSLFKWRVFPCLSPQHLCGFRYGKEQIWSLLFSFFLSLNRNKENNVVTFSHSQTDNETNFFQLQTKKKKNNPLSRTVELKLNWKKSSCDEEEEEEEEGFTVYRDEGEMLVLTAFSLPVADVEVDVDRSGQPLVAVGGDLHQETRLQQHFPRLHLTSRHSWLTAESLQHNVVIVTW